MCAQRVMPCASHHVLHWLLGVTGSCDVPKTVCMHSPGVPAADSRAAGLGQGGLLSGVIGGGSRDQPRALCLQETLTGHTDKVTAAKFRSTRYQAVTGSRDRTVKEWDLGKGACKWLQWALWEGELGYASCITSPMPAWLPRSPTVAAASTVHQRAGQGVPAAQSDSRAPIPGLPPSGTVTACMGKLRHTARKCLAWACGTSVQTCKPVPWWHGSARATTVSPL